MKQCLTGEFVLIQVNKDTLAKHMQIFIPLLRCPPSVTLISRFSCCLYHPPNAYLSPWESTECNEKAWADGRQEAHQRVARGYDNVRSLPVQIQSNTQEKQSQRKEAKEELEGFGLTDVTHLFLRSTSTFAFLLIFIMIVLYPFVTLCLEAVSA